MKENSFFVMKQTQLSQTSCYFLHNYNNCTSVISGNPIKLQYECTTNGATKWPVRTKRSDEYMPNTVV